LHVAGAKVPDLSLVNEIDPVGAGIPVFSATVQVVLVVTVTEAGLHVTEVEPADAMRRLKELDPPEWRESPR